MLNPQVIDGPEHQLSLPQAFSRLYVQAYYFKSQPTERQLAAQCVVERKEHTMCGVFGKVSAQPFEVSEVVEGLKMLEYRGYDSWGVGAATESGAWVHREVGSVSDIDRLGTRMTDTCIGHTRWATHGRVCEKNSHPQTDCSGRLLVVHNGIVENFALLREHLIENGHQLVSETDTELIAHLLEEAMDDEMTIPVFSQVMERLTGNNAVVVLDTAARELCVYRKGSPLLVTSTDEAAYVASDIAALLPYTKKVHALKDGEVVSLSARHLDIYQEGRLQSTVEWERVSYSLEGLSLQGYRHLMEKEIFEQPQVLRDIVRGAAAVEALAEDLITRKRVVLTGCGSAWYAALFGKYVLDSMEVRVEPASELGHASHHFDESTGVLALSQSGETIDLLEAVDTARERDARVLAMTNVPYSGLARNSDRVLFLRAGVERAVATTKALTAKMAWLVLLEQALADDLQAGIALLETAIERITLMLESETVSRLQTLGATLAEHRQAFVLGSGVYYPAALETALKIKEVSYVHAEGFATGELKHGVIALVEEGTHCIVIGQADGTSVAAANELNARGAYVVGMSAQAQAVYDEHFVLSSKNRIGVFEAVVMGQLLGYYSALARGLDPDKPRNLAKSVTVK